MRYLILLLPLFLLGGCYPYGYYGYGYGYPYGYPPGYGAGYQQPYYPSRPPPPPTRRSRRTMVANQITVSAQAPTHLRTAARRINSNRAHRCRGTHCPTILQIAGGGRPPT